MKLIKAIVDRLPETCMKCNHRYDNTCEITFKRLTDIRFDSRPDWCPLVSFDTLTWLADGDKVLIEIECDPQ